MNNIEEKQGFTLMELMAVIAIIGILAVIISPNLMSSTVLARQKADTAIAHEVKAALDRYQLDYGAYPKTSELTVIDGMVVCSKLIPKYISKLDKSATQQLVPEVNKGFGLASLTADPFDNTLFDIPNTKPVSNIIMIYLSGDGLAAEVRAYDKSLQEVLWSSAN